MCETTYVRERKLEIFLCVNSNLCMNLKYDEIARIYNLQVSFVFPIQDILIQKIAENMSVTENP